MRWKNGGGKYQSQAISAKTGEGVEGLLEKILLEAEMLALSAPIDGPAKGIILESTLEKGQGYVINVMIQTSTLQVGQVIVVGRYFGKIRAMYNHQGQSVEAATPGTPVQILGLNGAPQSGEQFVTAGSEQEARSQAESYHEVVQEQTLRIRHGSALERFQRELLTGKEEHFNIIIKGDADGSVEALSDALLPLGREVKKVCIVHKSIGSISESDVLLAATSKALIIGFNVKTDSKARKAIAQEKVVVKTFHLIYEAVDYLDTLLNPQEQVTQEVVLGKALVVKIFAIARIGTVAGCVVQTGTIQRNQKIRIKRSEDVLYEGPIKQLKREKEVIKEAKVGTECGISNARFQDVQVGDIIECLQG